MLYDLRTALRAITAHRWFSLAIVATLALGIGINTTVFTLVNAVLFKAMPFKDGERLVIVSNIRLDQPAGQNINGTSFPDFKDFREQTSSFESLEAVSVSGSATLSETGVAAERYRLARTTSGLFRAFRVEAVIGRGLMPADEDPAAPRVLVLGYSVWKSRYNMSPDV
ncbi:MAG: ABC transporter permease, partial [Vicinamibacterales bacterium]